METLLYKMSSINFNKKTFGFGYINGYSRFYQFSERWLFSTNHKYIRILYLLILFILSDIILDYIRVYEFYKLTIGQSLFDISMFTFFGGVKKTSSYVTGNLSNKLLKPIKYTSNDRGMGSIHVGKFQLPPVSTDNGAKLESDVSGFHDVFLALICNKPGCTVTNCATGNNNPCGVSASFHQQALDSNNLPAAANIILAGNGTHKTPVGKNTNVINSQVDMKGKPSPQLMVKETTKTTIDTNKTSFKESSSKTGYMQKDNHTFSVLNNLPSDAI